MNKLGINNDPLSNALKLIGGKWKIKILEKLINKPTRFGKLKKNLDTITSQMLSKQLKEMENDTLVKRKVIKSKPNNCRIFLNTIWQL